MALSFVTPDSISNNNTTTAPVQVSHARNNIIHTNDKVVADMAMYFARNDIKFSGEDHKVSGIEILSAEHSINIEASDITARALFIVTPELHIDDSAHIHGGVYMLTDCKHNIAEETLDGRMYLVNTIEDMEYYIHSYLGN